MPRGPKGEKRPADVIGNAVHVMRIATGESEESPQKSGVSVVVMLGQKPAQKHSRQKSGVRLRRRPLESAGDKNRPLLRGKRHFAPAVSVWSVVFYYANPHHSIGGSV